MLLLSSNYVVHLDCTGMVVVLLHLGGKIMSDTEVTVDVVPIDRVQSHRHNANKGSTAGDAFIRRSVARHGFREAGVLDRNNVLVSGNHRTEAAVAEGVGEAIIIDVPDSGRAVYLRYNDLDLSDDANPATELAVTLNRAAQVSINWDPVVMRSLVDKVPLKPLFDEKALRKMGLLAGGDEPAQKVKPPSIRVEFDSGEARDELVVELTSRGIRCTVLA